MSENMTDTKECIIDLLRAGKTQLPQELSNVKLSHLHVAGLKFQNLDLLQSITGLSWLSLDAAQLPLLPHLPSLRSLRLELPYKGNADIPDISPLKRLPRLRSLIIVEPPLGMGRLDLLAQMTELEDLQIYGDLAHDYGNSDALLDLRPIGSLSKLKAVTIKSCHVLMPDWSKMTRLQYLSLDCEWFYKWPSKNGGVPDAGTYDNFATLAQDVGFTLDWLRTLTRLESLTFRHWNEFSPTPSLRPIGDLPKLTNLVLYLSEFNGEPSAFDLTWLEGLTGLQSFGLHADQDDPSVTLDLTPFKKLTKLKSLVLNGDMIKDIEPIGTINSLSSLKLGTLDGIFSVDDEYYEGTAVEDLAPLARLMDLEYLLFRGPAMDFSTLANMKHFSKFRLGQLQN